MTKRDKFKTVREVARMFQFIVGIDVKMVPKGSTRKMEGMNTFPLVK